MRLIRIGKHHINVDQIAYTEHEEYGLVIVFAQDVKLKLMHDEALQFQAWLSHHGESAEAEGMERIE